MGADWGSVPAWVAAVAGTLSFIGAAVTIFRARSKATRMLAQERQRLANGVIGEVSGGKVVITNFSTDLVVELKGSFVIGTVTKHLSFDRDFVAPNLPATADVPDGCGACGRTDLVFEFRDVRGDVWTRQWGKTTRLGS